METICESVFSASLKEMALAGMDLAWLAGDLIRQEIADRRLLPLGAELGEAEFDILLYYRDTPAAACIADVIAGRAGGR